MNFCKTWYYYHNTRFHPIFVLLNITGLLIHLRIRYFLDLRLNRLFNKLFKFIKFYFKSYTYCAL